jgi:aryl-alcohol dehydrogenase-like predicted oxidoreductase
MKPSMAASRSLITAGNTIAANPKTGMGGALKGKRDRVSLMTKVCSRGRDKDVALRMLEQSMRRLQTDHLDLWQIHGVTFDNDPAIFIRPRGAAGALEQARREGKVRYLGFTGHKDPPSTSR